MGKHKPQFDINDEQCRIYSCIIFQLNEIASMKRLHKKIVSTCPISFRVNLDTIDFMDEENTLVWLAGIKKRSQLSKSKRGRTCG